MAYCGPVKNPNTFTSMNWLFGSGDWVAGTSSHTVAKLLLVQLSWRRFEPATVFALILFGSSPMQRPEPTLEIWYVGSPTPTSLTTWVRRQRCGVPLEAWRWQRHSCWFGSCGL